MELPVAKWFDFGGNGGWEAECHQNVKELNFLSSRSFTDHIDMCLFLIIIYMNFILFTAVVIITVRYFMQMALLDFKTHTRDKNENTSFSEHGTQVINFGNVFSTCLKTLRLHYFYLEISMLG
jgi:ABC-type protease/lipase transport system fused ATPase/permease subunit